MIEILPSCCSAAILSVLLLPTFGSTKHPSACVRNFALQVAVALQNCFHVPVLQAPVLFGSLS